MNFEYWLYCAVLQRSVQCGKVLYAMFTLRSKIETMGVFLKLYYTTGGKENKYCVC